MKISSAFHSEYWILIYYKNKLLKVTLFDLWLLIEIFFSVLKTQLCCFISNKNSKDPFFFCKQSKNDNFWVIVVAVNEWYVSLKETIKILYTAEKELINFLSYFFIYCAILIFFHRFCRSIKNSQNISVLFIFTYIKTIWENLKLFY